LQQVSAARSGMDMSIWYITIGLLPGLFLGYALGLFLGMNLGKKQLVKKIKALVLLEDVGLDARRFMGRQETAWLEEDFLY